MIAKRRSCLGRDTAAIGRGAISIHSGALSDAAGVANVFHEVDNCTDALHVEGPGVAPDGD